SSSLPKRMVRGTMSMSSSATRSAGRSQLLSVTTRAPAMSALFLSRLLRDCRGAQLHGVPVLGGPASVQDIGLRLLGQRDMNRALVVNVEGHELRAVAVRVLLGDRLGPADVVVHEELVGGVVGGVVHLP